MGSITRADIITAFQDHFGFPFCVCRHGDERKKELDKISTLGCIIMDTTDKRIWVCKGTPCSGQFREYAWARPGKLAEWNGIVMW